MSRWRRTARGGCWAWRIMSRACWRSNIWRRRKGVISTRRSTSSDTLEAARALLRGDSANARRGPLFPSRYGRTHKALVASGRACRARHDCRASHDRLAVHHTGRCAADRQRSPCRDDHPRRHIRAALARSGAARCGSSCGPALCLCSRPGRDDHPQPHFAHSDRSQPRSIGPVALSGAGDDRAVPVSRPLMASRFMRLGPNPMRRKSSGAARPISIPITLHWREQIARLRALHPAIVLYDAHSIRSHVPRLFDGELPQFNIGSYDGASCAAALTEAIAADCAQRQPRRQRPLQGRLDHPPLWRSGTRHSRRADGTRDPGLCR